MQFEMPFGKNVINFNNLDWFVQGYIEAMFFTDATPDNPELEYASFDDLPASELKAIVEDCKKFQQDNASLLENVYGRTSLKFGMYTEQQAGHDFWFTRNGHGVGFWDRGLGQEGDDLSDAARKFGEVSLYLGDDGKLYLE